MLACFAVDKSCKYVSFNDCSVFVQTIIDLSKCSRCVVEKPTGFGEEDLSLCKCSVLLGYVFK